MQYILDQIFKCVRFQNLSIMQCSTNTQGTFGSRIGHGYAFKQNKDKIFEYTTS